MSLDLRPYQDELYAEARVRLKKCRRLLIQLPTGGGKTVIVAKMLAAAASKGYTAWFNVHRRELVKQSVLTLTESANLPLGIVAAGFPGDRFHPTQVCSIGTLARRRHLLPNPTLIIWDEAHHTAAASWSEIFMAYPKAVHIGLTATPERLDGTGLGRWFDDMVCGPSVRDLIDMGWLADYKLFAPSVPDLSGVHSIGGEYNKRELSAAMAKSQVVGDALSHYRKHADGARAILFAWSIESSIEIARKFNEAGVAAEHVDGKTDDYTRDAAITSFRDGRTKILTNVNLFSEGFDVPAVEAVFDLAPSKSLGMTLQRWGRALRPAPGKDLALLFDHAGNSKMHGLPDDDREWSLEGRRKQAAKSDGPPVKECPKCYASVAAASSVCRHCGFKFATQSREIEEVAGDLAEVDKVAARAQRLTEQRGKSLEELVALGIARGYKKPEGWAKHVHAHNLSREVAKEAEFIARYGSIYAEGVARS